MLATPGIIRSKILKKQRECLLRLSEIPEHEIKKEIKYYNEALDMVTNVKDVQSLKSELYKYLENTFEDFPTHFKPDKMSKEDYLEASIDDLTTPWFLYFCNYDPAPTLEKVSCCVLALNGQKDWQVQPKENLSAISDALIRRGNKNITINEIPNLNHLFQECKTGAPEEYGSIKQIFSPVALEEILNWVIIHVK